MPYDDDATAVLDDYALTMTTTVTVAVFYSYVALLLIPTVTSLQHLAN